MPWARRFSLNGGELLVPFSRIRTGGESFASVAQIQGAVPYKGETGRRIPSGPPPMQAILQGPGGILEAPRILQVCARRCDGSAGSL